MAGAFQTGAYQDTAFQQTGGTGCGYQNPGFQSDAFQNCGHRPAVIAPAAGAARRKRYLIGDHKIRLTEQELDDYLMRLLRADEPVLAVKARPEDAALAKAVPHYPALLEQLQAAQQTAAIERLRWVAARLAQARADDEADIEMLLLH